MATLLMSLGSIGFCVSMYAISQLDPNNVVLALISGNAAGGAVKFGLVALLLFVLFKNGFESFWGKVALRFGSVGLIMFGATALFSPPILNFIYGVLRPLDLMLITEVGIIMAIVSLRSSRIPQPSWQLHKVLLPALEGLPRMRTAIPRLAGGMLASLREEQPRVAHQ